MTYSMARFAAYDWAKEQVHMGKPGLRDEESS